MSGLWGFVRRRLTWTSALLLLIIGYGVYMRLHGITWGLPYTFIDPDENVIVGHAYHIATGHLNPQFFYYPSLLLYLLAGVYRAIALVWHPAFASSFLAKSSWVVDPTPFYLAGRLLAVAFGGASIYLIYRLGKAAFSPLAGLLAALFLAVEPVHVRYSHVAVTDVPATAFSLLALVLLVGAAQGRGRRWLVVGAVAAGLATSVKYNLGMLFIPATVAWWYVSRRERGAAKLVAGAEGMSAKADGVPATSVRRVRAAARWGLGAARLVYLPMLLAFVLASPYVVLDFGHFWRDFASQNAIVARGWLGFEHVGNGYWYNLNVNLVGALGVALLAVAFGGLALALWRRTAADMVLVPYAVVYFLYVSSWHVFPDRYLIPILPLLLLLAARLCVASVRLRVVPRSVAVPALLAVLIGVLALPLADSVAYDRSLSGTDVRSVAQQWVEHHIPVGSRVATEAYGPPLVSRLSAPLFHAVGRSTAYYRVVYLDLPLPGQPAGGYSVSYLRSRHVRYVIVSSGVYARVLAAGSDYPRVTAFYAALQKQATLLKTFRPGPGQRGSVVKIYALQPPRSRLVSRDLPSLRPARLHARVAV